MATFKVLEDYAADLTPGALDRVRRRIRADYLKGVIDRDNYEELVDDLRAETTEAPHPVARLAHGDART